MLATLMISPVLHNLDHAVSTEKKNARWGKADRHKPLRAHSIPCMTTTARLLLCYSLDLSTSGFFMKVEDRGNLEVKTTSLHDRDVYLTLHNVGDVTFHNYSSLSNAMADKGLHYHRSSKSIHGDEVAML